MNIGPVVVDNRAEFGNCRLSMSDENNKKPGRGFNNRQLGPERENSGVVTAERGKSSSMNNSFRFSFLVSEPLLRSQRGWCRSTEHFVPDVCALSKHFLLFDFSSQELFSSFWRRKHGKKLINRKPKKL